MYICTLYLHYLHYFLFTLFIDVYNLFYLYFLLYLLISFFINTFIFICFFCVAVFLTQCFILFVDKRVVLSLLLLNLTFSCPRSQNGDPVNDCITHEIKVYNNNNNNNNKNNDINNNNTNNNKTNNNNNDNDIYS